MGNKNVIKITVETTLDDSDRTGYKQFCKTFAFVTLPTTILGNIDFSDIDKYIKEAEEKRLEMMEKLAKFGHKIEDSNIKYPKGV